MGSIMSHLRELFQTKPVKQQTQQSNFTIVNVFPPLPPHRNEQRSQGDNMSNTSADHNHPEAHSNDAMMRRPEQSELWIGDQPEMDSGRNCASTQSAPYETLV